MLYRIALCGFSEVEYRGMHFAFQHADASETGSEGIGYEVVDDLDDADFAVVDADSRPAVRGIVLAGRVAQAVFVGTSAPPGALRLPRPVDPPRVLRAMTDLASSYGAPTHEEPLTQGYGDPDEIIIVEPPVLMDAVPLPARAAPAQAPEFVVDIDAPAPPGAAGPIDIDIDVGAEAPAGHAIADGPQARDDDAAAHGPDAVRDPDDDATVLLPPAPPAAAFASEVPPATSSDTSSDAPSDTSFDTSSGTPTETHSGASPAEGAAAAPRHDKRDAKKAAARAAARRARLAHVHTDPGKLESMRDVLVLDADDTAAANITELLEMFGFRVHRARDIAQAADVLSRRALVAAFLDIALNGADQGDGLALLQTIHDLPRLVGHPTPAVLIVTEELRPADRVRAALAGIDAPLIKPVSRGDVARALEDCDVVLPADARTSR